MKIRVDASSLALTGYHKGGAWRYGVELLRHLPAVLPPDWELGLYFNFISGRHLERMRATLEETGVRDHVLSRFPPQLRNALRLPAEWTAGPHDLFHGPFDVVPRTRRAARVVTVHDLAFLRAPEGLPKDWIRERQRVVPPAVRRAHRVITVSAFTGRDVVERLGVDPARVQAIHHGIPADYGPPAEPEADLRRLAERYGIEGPFVLYLGTLQPNKNVEGLCAAWSLLRARGFGGSLVLAGSQGWLFDEMWARIQARGDDAGVLRTGFVDEEDIPRLYGNCRAFALVSRLEGFGIPLVEAMACGAPVVAADACSLPEVAGGAAVLVEPGDAESIAAGIERACGAERSAWVERGGARAAVFTWETSARAHVEAYRAALATARSGA